MPGVALVIGGNGGIGSEIVRVLIEEGMRVCATYCTHKDKVEKLATEFALENLAVYQMDVSQEASVRGVVDEIVRGFGAIDAVIFTVTPPVDLVPFFDTQWNDYERHLQVHVKGLFHVAKCLASQIKAKRRTKIVALLTEACTGKTPSRMSDYITAKYALMGLAKSLAVELARYNCSVNMISPGMTDTPLISKFPPKWVEMTAENNPSGKIAQPADTARVVSFLVSEKADHLNGVNILVNGEGIMP